MDQDGLNAAIRAEIHTMVKERWPGAPNVSTPDLFDFLRVCAEGYHLAQADLLAKELEAREKLHPPQHL